MVNASIKLVKPAMVNASIKQYLVLCDLFVISLHSAFLSIKPVLSNYLSYVTIFHCSFGRSHKIGLTVHLTKYFSQYKLFQKKLILIYYVQSNLLQRPPLLSNNLYYVTLILIIPHSAFHINQVKVVFNDHLSCVTLFQRSLGRSRKTGLTARLDVSFVLQAMYIKMLDQLFCANPKLKIGEKKCHMCKTEVLVGDRIIIKWTRWLHGKSINQSKLT